eukprot:COSAG01_NODE_10478_length_2156_cov_887.982013_3_plen_174_part_00
MRCWAVSDGQYGQRGDRHHDLFLVLGRVHLRRPASDFPLFPGILSTSGAACEWWLGTCWLAGWLPACLAAWICSGSLISSALACCLLTPLALSLQAVFVLLPLTATRTVLSRVVSDPRARHRALLRREAGQAGVFAPSRARERKAVWRASSSIGRSWSSSLRAPCSVRACAPR